MRFKFSLDGKMPNFSKSLTATIYVFGTSSNEVRTIVSKLKKSKKNAGLIVSTEQDSIKIKDLKLTVYSFPSNPDFHSSIKSEKVLPPDLIIFPCHNLTYLAGGKKLMEFLYKTYPGTNIKVVATGKDANAEKDALKKAVELGNEETMFIPADADPEGKLVTAFHEAIYKTVCAPADVEEQLSPAHP